jgi:hypothetical protein
MSEIGRPVCLLLVLTSIAASVLACNRGAPAAPQVAPPPKSPADPTSTPGGAPPPTATAGPADGEVCARMCQQEGFSTGRCGCSSCLREELMLDSLRELTGAEWNAIQDDCGPLPESEPSLPCMWVCCCS